MADGAGSAEHWTKNENVYIRYSDIQASLALSIISFIIVIVFVCAWPNRRRIAKVYALMTTSSRLQAQKSRDQTVEAGKAPPKPARLFRNKSDESNESSYDQVDPVIIDLQQASFRKIDPEASGESGGPTQPFANKLNKSNESSYEHVDLEVAKQEQPTQEVSHEIIYARVQKRSQQTTNVAASAKETDQAAEPKTGHDYDESSEDDSDNSDSDKHSYCFENSVQDVNNTA